MTWAAYLLGQHWPIALTVVLLTAAVVLFTRDRKDPR